MHEQRARGLLPQPPKDQKRGGWAIGYYTIKSCGKQHSHCPTCRPDIYKPNGISCKKNCTCKRHNVSDMRRQRMSQAMAERLTKWQPCGPTILEHALSLLLEDANFEYEMYVKFSRYVVDAYIPSYNIAFEADGLWWHRDPNKIAIRDKELLQTGIGAVIHLTENDLDGYTVGGTADAC